MKHIVLLFIPLLLLGCGQDSQELPPITKKHEQQAQELSQSVEKALRENDILNLEENFKYDSTLSDQDYQQQGIVLEGIFAIVLGWIRNTILPNHLEGFNKNYEMLNKQVDSFVEFKGVFGKCYQFRLFYKYEDPRVDGVKWASSILSIPAKSNKNTNAGVVLAPTLDGFEPLVEAGLWLKLCNNNLASLMPESIYKKESEESSSWQKLHFDPTPEYKSVDEYSLYDDSIKRYETVLRKNLEFLRSFETLKTDQDILLSKYNVMPVKSENVGFWGSSFGAVVGSIVVATDHKIKGAVLNVGGGNLPYIVSQSKIDLFKHTREQQMKILGIKSLEEYKKFISQYLHKDPLFYAKNTDRDRIYMIIAKKDDSVPTAAQYQLHEYFGSPKNSKISSGHIGTILFTSWFNQRPTHEALDFMVNKLSQK